MTVTIRARVVPPIPRVVPAVMARVLRPRLAVAGYAAGALAALGVPVHVYYGLGGTAGRRLDGDLVDRFGVAAAEYAWRAGNWAAAAVLGAVALLALALVRPWGRVLPDWLPVLPGRRVPSPVPLVPAFVVTALSIAYAVDGVLRGMGLTGADLTAPERGALDLLGWIGARQHAASPLDLPVGLWALALGLLLFAATTHYLAGRAARRVWLVVVALGTLRLLLGVDPGVLEWW